MEGELQVIHIELVQGAALPTGRILVDTRDPETGESGRALVWVFLQPDRRWNLIFQAPRASFDSNLESFETSGASLELR